MPPGIAGFDPADGFSAYTTHTSQGGRRSNPSLPRVSYKRLGSVGKPITKRYKGQEIQLCGKPCIKKSDADPFKDMTEPK